MVSFPDWLTQGTVVLPPAFGTGILAWGVFFGWSTVSTLIVPALLLVTLNPVLLLGKQAGLSQRYLDVLWTGNYILPGVYFVWSGLIGGTWVILLSGVVTIGFGLAFLLPVIGRESGDLMGYGVGIFGFPLVGIHMWLTGEWIVGVLSFILALLFIWRGLAKFNSRAIGEE